jgi:hypothetical protein
VTEARSLSSTTTAFARRRLSLLSLLSSAFNDLPRPLSIEIHPSSRWTTVVACPSRPRTGCTPSRRRCVEERKKKKREKKRRNRFFFRCHRFCAFFFSKFLFWRTELARLYFLLLLIPREITFGFSLAIQGRKRELAYLEASFRKRQKVGIICNST